MFNKQLQSTNITDIEKLVNTTKLPESQHIDYKRELDTTNDGKKELLKDLSAFANSGGGNLLIGIDESEGVPITITGSDKAIGRQRADEWINAVVSAHTDPKLEYDIALIPHSTDTTKVIIVIEVRDSPRKPHMVTIDRRNNYYRRHLDITSPATHQEVRDMFYESQAAVEKVRGFLDNRQLLDERMSPFANTKYSRNLYNRAEENWRKRPHIAFSMVPMQLQSDTADPATGPLRDWLGANASGHYPIPQKDIYYPHEDTVDIEGITFHEPAYVGREFKGFKRYTEFNENGYIESGLSRDIFWIFGDGDERHTTMHLTNTMACAEAFLRFAKIYYEHLNLNDDIYYQISVANVRGAVLAGFDSRPHPDGSRMATWAEPFGPYNAEPPVVKNYDNFKLAIQFNPQRLNDAQIKEYMRELSVKVSRALSLTIDKAYGADGTLDPSHLARFL